MTDRGRGRRTGLAVAAILVAAVAVAVGGEGDRTVVVTDADGRVLAQVSLGSDSGFSLRYRNSLYGTLALERFVAVDGGSFQLTALEAEQLAVLEEYYAVNEAPRVADSGWWTSVPADSLQLDQLRVAATDLGRRTLIVPGQPPLELWRLVDDAASSVLISVEGSP